MHVFEQLRRRNEETLVLHDTRASVLSILIRQIRVIKISVFRIEVRGEVFRNETVEQHVEHVALEIPPIYRTSEIVRDFPDGFMQLSALRRTVSCGGVFCNFVFDISHSPFLIY